MRQTSSYRLTGNVSVSTAESLLDIRSLKDFQWCCCCCETWRELFLASLYAVRFFSHAVRISRCLDESGRGFRRRRFVSSTKGICVRALQCVRRNEHGREGCLSVFLGRDLARVRRGYDVLLIFQQDSSRGLFG